MKNKILILLAVLTLSSCFNMNKDGCPADMHLTFSVEDPYEDGTYDSRLATDVMLYIFKDKRVVSKTLIPYENISNGKPHTIRKDQTTSGNLDIIAWAVPASGGDPTSIPQLSMGDNLSDVYRQLVPLSRAVSDCHPSMCMLHVARKTTREAIDSETRHNLGLNYSDCRVEVRVTDNNFILSQPGCDPKVMIRGTMTRMDMDFKGCGDEAIVHNKLLCPSADSRNYSTGRIGLMPSAEGQTLSVDISNGVQNLITLDAPANLLPLGAFSGGLIIFEYTLNAPEFTIVVNGFRHNVVIIDDM